MSKLSPAGELMRSKVSTATDKLPPDEIVRRLRKLHEDMLPSGAPSCLRQAANLIEAQSQLMTELMDVAICKVEGVASNLRGLVGYAKGTGE
jgi:hypothetical protein